jgi:sugar lactone lactonase YvrE
VKGQMGSIANGWIDGARRRRLVGALATTLAFVALCALPVSPAFALVSEFGSEGEGAGQFAEANGIAINQETGDTYIADTANNRVVQFSSEGVFIRAWGFGVSDGTSEAFQRCEAPGPCFAGLPGAAGGQFSQPKGIAIDNSAGLTHGDVYVQDTVNRRVERFGPDGEFILTFGAGVNKTAQEKGETANEDVCPVNPGDVCQAGTPDPGPSQFEQLSRNGIAVGPSGTIYVGDISRVQKFAPSGAPEGEIAIPEAGAIEALAVDSSGDLYEQGFPLGVHKYDGAGVELGEARDPNGGQVAIALGPSDELLVSDPAQGRIFVYESTGTQLASVVELSSGDARGGIAFGNTVEALYTIHSKPARVTLLTLPPPGPVILEGSEAAGEVLPTSARLEATVNPEGAEATKCHFEYGTSTAYGESTPEAELSGGPFEDQPVSAQLTGLSPDTTYHFRIICENAAKQITEGPDQTFTSAPPVSIDGESVTNVTATSAKLNAELNAHGLKVPTASNTA